MDKHISIGTDIGGDHISCAAVDLNTQQILKESIFSNQINNQAQAGEIISIWSETIKNAISKVPLHQVKGIGIAMPGPFDYLHGICYIKGIEKYKNLYGFNIGDAIISSLDVPDDFQVRFMNNASAFGVGEALFGKTYGYSKSMALTIGTGLGSSFIIDGIPVVKNEEVPKGGSLFTIQYKDGIAEDYFSTRRLISEHNKLSDKAITDFHTFCKNAEATEDIRNILVDFGGELALFMVPYIKRFDPGMLIIGGIISNVWKVFGDVFTSTIKNEGCKCKVGLSDLNQNASIYGSAWLLNEDFWKSIYPILPLM